MALDPTRAGVIGSGVVGRVLAAGLRSRGHDVTLGTRDPAAADEELRAWSEQHGVPLATFADAAAAAELIVLATKGVANEQAIALAGPASFAGKVVIDATNPLDFSGGGPALAVGHSDSGGEIVQRAIPDARVVKAFNTVGNTLFVDPRLPGGRPTMFIAGDDADANATVVQLLDDFGWDALVVGGIEASRELESLCILWVKAAQARGGRYDHAIALVVP
jgi:8-hydroxy-5-deazaflavin:NADPH oxidoreductase